MNRACPPCTHACRQGRDCKTSTTDSWHPAERFTVNVLLPLVVLLLTGLAAGWIA
jgi:hypothetical protein